MKKDRKQAKEFQILKGQLAGMQEVARHSKTGNLWQQEAAVRKKLKTLGEMRAEQVKGYSSVYKGYRELLDSISIRLLEEYNHKNNTNYRFLDMTEEYETEYLRSGIIPVLVATHIPKQVAAQFEELFPEHPKDEYEETRGIKRHFYLHLGETNTGKTYQAIERLKKSRKGIYLAPLRILALEIYERLNESGVSCNLLTGEEEMLTEGAMHQSSTIEKLNLEREYEVAVIDEIQMIGDSQRGAAWTRAVLGIKCREIHICGAFNAKELLIHMIEACGDTYEVKEYYRNVPLQMEEEAFRLQEVKAGDAIIVFAKKRVLEIAKLLKEQKVPVSMIYGDLPPEVRKMQYHEFIEGSNNVLVSTDAIGMGVNLPIRRIAFLNTKKFDGDEVRPLTSQEVKQIAGRAGRKGIYEVGYVAAIGDNGTFIRESIEAEDESLQEAVLGPSERLLQIEGLRLREKLALWSTREEAVPGYRKMDVRDYIFLLDKLQRYKLKEESEWRLMRLPFDVHNDAVVSAFIFYVEQYFVRGQEVLTKPEQKGEELEALETYYQKINLYYSFAKSFLIPFEEEWVYEERTAVSEKINVLLVRGKYGE